MGNNVFQELIRKTVSVKLPSGAVLDVRRMPFTTVLHVLSEVAAIIQMELSAERLRPALEHLEKVARDTAKTDIEKGLTVIERVTPIVYQAVINSPKLIQDILNDVLIDVPTEDMRYLAVEDGLAILHTVFSDMDKQVIAKQVVALFFEVTGVIKTALAKAETESVEQKTSEGNSV